MLKKKLRKSGSLLLPGPFVAVYTICILKKILCSGLCWKVAEDEI